MLALKVSSASLVLAWTLCCFFLQSFSDHSLVRCTLSPIDVPQEESPIRIPPIRWALLPLDELRGHAALVSTRLDQLIFGARAHPQSLPPTSHATALKTVQEVIKKESHVMNLLNIGSVPSSSSMIPPSPRYALTLSDEHANQIFQTQTEPTVATMALITVRRGLTNEIELNGFVRAEGIQSGSHLRQSILGAGGAQGTELPFSHDLDSLLKGRIRGFK